MDAVDAMKTVNQESTEASGGALRCGTDLIRISRIMRALERQGDRFARRIYTAAELMDCAWPEKPKAGSLSARFAAKEAVAKALGTGIGPQGVRWTDIEIRRQPGDAPRVHLQGAAARRYAALQGRSVSISMSHDGDFALAFCVIDCTG